MAGRLLAGGAGGSREGTGEGAFQPVCVKGSYVFGNRALKVKREQTKPPRYLRAAIRRDFPVAPPPHGHGAALSQPPACHPVPEMAHHQSQNALLHHLVFTMCPQQTVRLSPKDAVTPVLQTKTKPQGQMPNLVAEVLMAERVQGSRDSRNYCKSVRNGVFLVISVNKDVTVISDPSPLGQPGRRRIPV